MSLNFRHFAEIFSNWLFPEVNAWTPSRGRVDSIPLSLYIVHLTDLYLNIYAAAAFTNLANYLANDMEKIQKRALSIIIPLLQTRSYEDALAGIARL